MLAILAHTSVRQIAPAGSSEPPSMCEATATPPSINSHRSAQAVLIAKHVMLGLSSLRQLRDPMQTSPEAHEHILVERPPIQPPSPPPGRRKQLTTDGNPATGTRCYYSYSGIHGDDQCIWEGRAGSFSCSLVAGYLLQPYLFQGCSSRDHGNISPCMVSVLVLLTNSPSCIAPRYHTCKPARIHPSPLFTTSILHYLQ
ncbi:hypothetical protein DL93DRAFT_551594 [Clavulina sp. PMI_390]|nr:hypothetical protein DL93DRAFT_551594 [Clavulina sp. PMI_390]